ncbi:MAG: hypothetical protein HYX72_07250 [Acidobacteria bacterium]|nr:hypothetical protein [Acidobacteriota bacterium]
MMQNSSKLSFYLAVLLALAAPSASAQEQSGEEQVKATRIALGGVSGGAKSQVMVPVFLTPYPAGTAIGSVTVTIEYPNKGITFLKAEKSFLLDGVNADFQVQNDKDAKDPSKSVIQLEVSTKGEPRKPLREGLILTLIFRIEPDAPAGNTVNLSILKAGAVNLESKPIEPLVSKNGSIEILAPEAVPYVSCFFFTH